MLFFYGIWMLCHHGQSPKKGEKSKQRFFGYNEKTHFPFVKSARKPRNVRKDFFIHILNLFTAEWRCYSFMALGCRPTVSDPPRNQIK